MNGNCGSNSLMSNDLKNGMAFAISNWSTFDNWLWKDRCAAQTCNTSDLNFNNISIKTGGTGPTPPPTPIFNFGDNCGSSWDG